MAITNFFFLFVGIQFLAKSACVTVVTSKGTVTGYRADFGTNMSNTYYGSADVFLGIPYAEPPIGTLRFQPPQNKAAWNSPLNTTSFDSYTQCPQPPSAISGPPLPSSEDCLYLNIFSPNVSATSKYPVMVFIHGGAFATGQAQFYGIKGTVRNLVNRGVIVVTIQYRLGLLGFFTTKTSDFPANLGMLDQVLALKWVQQEIAAFGGDKTQVTIFGESAGAASVSAHTYSPLSKGLFQKAIMESGTALLGLDGTFGYKHLSELRAKQLCNFTDAQWTAADFAPLKQCLQNMTFQQFIALEYDNPLGWNYVVDGNFLPAFPRDLAANRENIPILIGTNHDEWALWEITDLLVNVTKMSNYTQEYWHKHLYQFTQFYGANQSLIMQLVDKVYVDPILPTPDPVNDTMTWFKVICQFSTDQLFTSLAAREVDLWQRINKNPQVYMYEFVYPTAVFAFVPSITWPVYHAEELFYVWMQETLWDYNPYVSPDDFIVANFLGSTWTDFAKNGKVNWNPVTFDSPNQYMEIGVNVTQKPSYRETSRVFWNQIVPVIAGVYPQAPSSGSTSTSSVSTTTTSSVITTPTSSISTPTTPAVTTTTTPSVSTTTTSSVSTTTTSSVSIPTTPSVSTTTTSSVSTATTPSGSLSIMMNSSIVVTVAMIMLLTKFSLFH